MIKNRKSVLTTVAILIALCLFTLTACGLPSGGPSGGSGGASIEEAPSDAPGENPGSSVEEPSDPGEDPGEDPENPGEEPETPEDPEDPKDPEEPEVLKPTTVYLVGDSTVCAFSDKYYYPRYGYGTQLGQYLNGEATVVNLALSGRSSKSFIAEANYQTLKDSIKEGDYLIIGFGHNDEKSDEPARFTDASKPYTDPTSFGYHLNEYYVKVAQSKGATPILCTPIVRAASDNMYDGAEGHITATGNYAQAIRDLGAALSVSVIDLTAATAERYVAIGFEEACKYHAVTAGKYAEDGTTVVPNMDTVDKTHLNVYGAKYVAYLLANGLKKVDGIKNYVLDDIATPTEKDLTPIPGYVVPTYAAPDLGGYTAPSHFATLSEGWYGTAFGDTGGNPQSSSNGYFAQETSAGVFKVGNIAAKGKGKIASSADGIAFAFRQVDKDKNFTLSASGKILETADKDQAGFGLMLRDDTYLNLTAADASIASNYLTAGFLTTKTGINANFYRENGTLKKGNEISSTLHAAGDTFTATIERVGQTVTVTVVYGGQTYTRSYYDFDLLAKDNGYMYVGMFATRGTVVEFTDVTFTVTGSSQGA